MRTLGSLTVLGLVLATLSPSIKARPESPNAQGSSFPLLCRGPFGIEAQYDRANGAYKFVVVLRPNTTRAGANGELLAAGRSAFIDRPLSSSEPLQILWYLQVSSPPSEVPHISDRRQEGTYFMMISNIVMQCSGDPNCILQVPVRNERVDVGGANVFAAYDWYDGRIRTIRRESSP